MQLLYTDETNIDPSTSEFFAYAGVSIPDQRAAALSLAIDELRARYGYTADDLLKFNTVERPAHISPEAHREIKQHVIEAAVQNDVKLFASFILHNIAKSTEEARKSEINRICLHFDYFLHRINDYGLVLIDPFQDNAISKFIRQKFSVGVVGLPYSPTYRLTRVLGFHFASIGSSNFCSVIDIVLGSLRYAVNNMSGTASQIGVAQVLLRQLAPLAIRNTAGRVDEISVFFSPKTVNWAKYLQKYDDLHSFLAQNGFDCTQVPGRG